MLIRHEDILQHSMPMLLVSAGSSGFAVVASIQLNEDGQYNARIIQETENGLCDQWLLLESPPFHIGDEVWELDYGQQILSIRDTEHGAWEIWREWRRSVLE